MFCFPKYIESNRVRETIPFETIRYGTAFPHETFDIYGNDLPKGTDIAMGVVFLLIILLLFSLLLIARTMRDILAVISYGEISDAPIYIYVHGGYWQIMEICKEVNAYGATPLVTAGIKVIVMNYEKCPNVSLEQLVDEMERAIDFILDFALENGTRYLNLK